MLVYNPNSLEVHEDPYPIWKRMRDEAPVYYNPDFNFYALTRYDDVLNAFLDPATFSSSKGTTIESVDDGGGRLNALDPPRHTRMRKLLSRLFTPKRMTELEPFIRTVAKKYLDEVEGRDEFDLVQDFSLRFPLDVISELLGIPEDMRETIHVMGSKTVLRDPDPAKGLADVRAAMGEVMGLFAGMVAERRKSPKDDIISMLLQAELTDDDGTPYQLPDEAVIPQFLLLAGAGHETVMKTIGNGAVALQKFPDQRKLMIDDPGLIPNGVEEMLRFDNPAPTEARWTMKDVTLHGVTIPKDSRVALLQGAANRDERQYPNPDTFDLHRPIDRPLWFGFGIHLCLGANLARTETRVAFEELLRRFPKYEVDMSRADRGPITVFRGYKQLPIITNAK